MIKKYYYILFIIVLISLFYFVYDRSVNADEIVEDPNEKLVAISNNFPTKQNIKNIIYNKVIVIGDSRMSLMRNRKNEIEIPTNFTFIADGGTKIDWFSQYATVILKKILDSKDEKIQYHILINMGVNDLDSRKKPEDISNGYYKLYYNLAKEYPTVKFYLLSVNPIDERIIYKKIGKNQLRTSAKIISYNKQLETNIIYSKVDNMKYCDSYNNLYFSSPDGLHYDSKTDEKIIDFMVNKCIIYE